MNYEKIHVYDYLRNSKIAFVLVRNSIRKHILNEIKLKYGNKRKYAHEILKISANTLDSELYNNKYLKFDRLLKIIGTLGISTPIFYDYIISFYAKGSNTCKEIVLPRELEINEFFVEGYALYLAEGDNGSNGKTLPRKVRFSNSELAVHKRFINWLNTYFPNNDFYFNVMIPYPKILTQEHRNHIVSYINLDERQLKVKTYKWKRKTGFVYKTCLDSALLIDFILAVENKVKELCLQDGKLAAAYIRGMMIGEGTAYFNKSRYVRIEMKNEKEIKYLHELFVLLGYDCKPTLRTTRSNMWSLLIGAKQLKKYYEEIGFGIHEKRQKILEKAANKVLKVNQYC